MTTAAIVAVSVAVTIGTLLGSKTVLKHKKEDQEENDWREVLQVLSKVNPIALMLMLSFGALCTKVIVSSSSLLETSWIAFLFISQAFAFSLTEYFGVLMESENKGLLVPE